MEQTLYLREKRLTEHGIAVRRAHHFEEQRNEYGDKLLWVIDFGDHRQARTAYRTRKHALEAAETYLPLDVLLCPLRA